MLIATQCACHPGPSRFCSPTSRVRHVRGKSARSRWNSPCACTMRRFAESWSHIEATCSRRRATGSGRLLAGSPPRPNASLDAIVSQAPMKSCSTGPYGSVRLSRQWPTSPRTGPPGAERSDRRASPLDEREWRVRHDLQRRRRPGRPHVHDRSVLLTALVERERPLHRHGAGVATFTTWTGRSNSLPFPFPTSIGRRPSIRIRSDSTPTTTTRSATTCASSARFGLLDHDRHWGNPGKAGLGRGHADGGGRRGQGA